MPAVLFSAALRLRRENQFFPTLLASLIWAVCATATPTPAPRPAPEGLGKAKFGMSVEQVRRRYPALAPAPSTAATNAWFKSPELTRFVLPQLAVQGLKEPADIELRFWKNRLWTIIVYYGDNPSAEVRQALSQQYGAPSTQGHDPTWVWPDRAIVTVPRQSWYSIADTAIGKDAQRGLLEALHAAPRAPTPRPPSAPAAPH